MIKYVQYTTFQALYYIVILISKGRRTSKKLDPYHLAGSGSTSGNVDPDPSSKKNIMIN